MPVHGAKSSDSSTQMSGPVFWEHDNGALLAFWSWSSNSTAIKVSGVGAGGGDANATGMGASGSELANERDDNAASSMRYCPVVATWLSTATELGGEEGDDGASEPLGGGDNENAEELE